MSLTDDIRAIRERDPAARSTLEVVLTYPGLHALALHRVAHVLQRHGRSLLARVVSHLGRQLTGIEIHPAAVIGRRLFIDHGMGVVIGETAVVGDDVTMYQGVTLGGTGKERGKRHPTIGDGVTIGVGAKVLGAVTVGTGAKIGGGAVVLRDVPPFTTAVGVPARNVAVIDPESGLARRLETLPDPDRETLAALLRRVEQLERQIRELEAERVLEVAREPLGIG
ncbi:MAG: Serine acetyltransferase [uncultured Thermomicrobiales bacterium]|uniref:Serine acetyltransferase n=1 Tax=uncultured Thermomicrobiales bacterium TaxID=1645740 RepID=A0A6J4V0E5_9BACT|nr:MAG: Serine acetyltransferase [uncultured Thermomicrobiales bacterium]